MMWRTALALSLFSVLIAAAPAKDPSGGAESYEALIVRAENLWLQRNYDECAKVCNRLIKLYPDRADPYWRKARVIYDRYEDLPREQRPDDQPLLASFQEIESLSRTCMLKEPDNGCCYLWLGVGMGRHGTTEGMVSIIKMAPELESSLLKGIKLKPAYRAVNGTSNALGDLHEMLGQYYRIVPEWTCNFPFKQLLKTCGDLDKSVMHNLKAVALDPERIEYVKELGISLICYGRQRNQPEKVKEGLEYLRKVSKLPVKKPQDKIDQEHAKMLIQNPAPGCGYSRDKQQKQSKEVYLK